MFKKGRKRESKGLAVVYFVIGLVILLIILAVIYFALVELDYSDRIKDPDATMRAYVEMTPDPNAYVPEDDVFGSEESASELDVDLTVATNTPAPTPTPTPEPTPTPTPEPTPTPTPLPPTMLAQPKTEGFTLPTAVAANCQAEITRCYVSAGDENRRMYLAGYGYIDNGNYDAALSQLYLVVNQPRTNRLIAYQATMRPGISGDPHDGAVCKNPANADFEVSFDVSQIYTDDVYDLGLVIGYKAPNQRKASYYYYAFPGDVNFAVQGGQVTEPIRVAGAVAVEATETPGAAASVSGDTGFDESEPEDMEPPVTPVPTPVGQMAQGDYDPALAGATQPPAANGVYDPALAGATQPPTINNAQEALSDTAAIQEQIYQNQMGVG